MIRVAIGIFLIYALLVGLHGDNIPRAADLLVTVAAVLLVLSFAKGETSEFGPEDTPLPPYLGEDDDGP